MANTPPLDAAAVAAIAARLADDEGGYWEFCEGAFRVQCDDAERDIAALLATLAHAHALLDALAAVDPVCRTGVPCAYCDAYVDDQPHAAACPWAAARRYRAGG